MSSFFLPARRMNSNRSAQGNTWSLEDIQQLRELAVAGVPPDVIAVRLRRTRSAIRNKAGMHGISLRRQEHESLAQHDAPGYRRVRR